MIAVFLGAVETDFAAESREFFSYRFGDLVYRGFVVAGRFDFYQIADCRDDCRTALGEIGDTTARFKAGGIFFSGNRLHDSIVL
jgi:hypothetical protein